MLIVIIACDVKTSQSYFDEACKLEDEGKYEKAILLLDKAIEKNPKFIGAYINRGADKSMLSRYEEAIKDYESVMEMDADNVLAIVNKANNLKRLAKYEEAISFYDKAVELKGSENLQIDWVDNPFIDFKKSEYDVPWLAIQYERAFAYYEIDSLNKALVGFNICVNNNYMKKEALNEIGNLFYISGRLQEACKYFQQSASFGDEDGTYNFNEFCNKEEDSSY